MWTAARAATAQPKATATATRAEAERTSSIGEPPEHPDPRRCGQASGAAATVASVAERPRVPAGVLTPVVRRRRRRIARLAAVLAVAVVLGAVAATVVL